MAGLTQLLTRSDRRSYGIKELKTGSAFIEGGLAYVVTDVMTYEEVRWKDFSRKKQPYVVTELKTFCISNGATVYFEWEEDDTVEATVTTRALDLKELRIGGTTATRDAIEAIADEEDGEVTFDGNVYYYEEEDTYAALFFSEKLQEVPVRMFAFESDRGEYLTIELWYDDKEDAKPSKEAYLSRDFHHETIEVIKI